MNFQKIFGLLLFVLLCGVGLNAQELKYEKASGLYSDEQNKRFEKSQLFMNRAETLKVKAEDIENKNQKYRKKQKKFDKKTWEAKKLKIEAQTSLLKAYENAVKIYSEIVKSSTFFNEADKSTAENLDAEAKKLIKTAQSRLAPFKRIRNKKKDMQKMPSSGLNNALTSIDASCESAIENEKKAMDILLNQVAKKALAERDERAWTEAQEVNTAPAYQNYLNEFESGAHADEARQKISELQSAGGGQNMAASSSGYTFQVQIAASEKFLDNYKLRPKYGDVEKIERVYVDGYYKYRVGSFATYKQAAEFRDSIKGSAYDAFVVAFDSSGVQVEITDSMKQ